MFQRVAISAILAFAALASRAHAAPPAKVELDQVRVPLPLRTFGASWSLVVARGDGRFASASALVHAAGTWRIDLVAGRARVAATEDRALYRDAAGVVQAVRDGDFAGHPLAHVLAALGVPGGVAVADMPGEGGHVRLAMQSQATWSERDLGPVSDFVLVPGAATAPLVVAGALDAPGAPAPRAGHLLAWPGATDSHLTPTTLSTASPNTYRALAAVATSLPGGVAAAFMHPQSGIHVVVSLPDTAPRELVVPATGASPAPACEALRLAGPNGIRMTTAAPNGLGLFRIGDAPTVYLARLEHRAHFVGSRFHMPPDTCSATGHRDCYMARRALVCDVRDQGTMAVVVGRVEPERVVDCWRREVGDVAADALTVATFGPHVVVGWLRPRPHDQSEATFVTLDGPALAARCATP